GLSGYETTFFAANWHAVQKSTDNGQTWSPAWGNDIGQLVGADFVKSQSYVRGWVLGAGIDEGSNRYATIATYYEAPTAVPGSEPRDLPIAVQLDQNFPNPFNPTTVVRYQLPLACEVKLVVFDMLGRTVSILVNERRDAGYHEVQFDGGSLASGVYLCRMTAGNYVDTKKLVLLR
ncbi:MAG TPA: T9SS type A sorting domain-containing protein, partial [Bacteroidota bacterium]|nr:T9SS type A sorting domain-containing protein [Bacteroidota bacterium]